MGQPDDDFWDEDPCFDDLFSDECEDFLEQLEQDVEGYDEGMIAEEAVELEVTGLGKIAGEFSEILILFLIGAAAYLAKAWIQRGKAS